MASRSPRACTRRWIEIGVFLIVVSFWALPSVSRTTLDATVSGRVFDGESGDAIENATVILIHPASATGEERQQEIAVSGPAGDFEFDHVPPGSYTIEFVKSGYRVSKLENFEVQAGQDNIVNFPMPPNARSDAKDVLNLDAFVVEAELADELMDDLELRLDSDQMLNLMSVEDFSKYAASDVADALKRVAGVNVVEGQFAIIRGLDDRYSSTLYNGAPIPSPDPDRQSVQLDLLPAEIVGNLVVSKTFIPELPSNSSGGSIDIVTHQYPEETTLSLSLGSGFSDRATDRFLRYYEPNPVGVPVDPESVIEQDFSVSLAGRHRLLNREVRFKLVGARELDFDTREGVQESREPDRGVVRRRRLVETGDLALGILSLSRGRFDLTESEATKQHTVFVASGMDLDEAGRHKVDGSFFFVRKSNDVLQRRERGFIPGFDYGPLLAGDVTEVDASDFVEVLTLTGPLADFRENQDPADGSLFYTVIDEHRAFSSERDLMVTQLNGSHEFEKIEGLTLNWAWNHARAKQDESSLRAVIFYEPENPLAQVPSSVPSSVAEIGPGAYAVNNRSLRFNANEIDETQEFVRADFGYERSLLPELNVALGLGLWYENANRDVTARVALQPRLPGVSANAAIVGLSPLEVGGKIFSAAEFGAVSGGFSSILVSDSKLSREISALALSGKLTVWEDLDLQGGVRLEDIQIRSSNDPFTDQVVNGSPAIFPGKYLYCDRIDNPSVPGELAANPGVVFNDQIIGIRVPIDQETGFVDRITREEIRECIDGRIDEQKVLPSAGLTYRPTFALDRVPGLGWLEGHDLEGLTLRAAYSRTFARPSFRELSYYVTADPGTDDLVLGNPQLGLSDVESWDLRAEYVWGDLGDLVAISGFWKTIDDPIEVIVIRDPFIVDSSVPARYRTFFNNPSGADLRGFEVEARLHLGMSGLFGRLSDYLDFFSVGGNYTRIDASVDRSQAEIDRTDLFFLSEPGTARFAGYRRKRRLFGQPEWIANADVSFVHEEWGSKITLAYFAISEVLDAAGSVALNPNNEVTSFELDRYLDEYYQLDLVVSQRFEFPWVPGEFRLGVSVKNLTDSTRKVIYDQAQTVDDVRERAFKRGRDFAFSMKYQVAF